MKLSCLLRGISYKTKLQDVEIEEITCDSRKAHEGIAFACLKGMDADGHDFAKKAAQDGASAIICEKDLGLENQVLVDDTHMAYAKMCANIERNPSKLLRFIGITGTNGKTTVTKIIKDILTDKGFKVGLIGTIQNEIGDVVIPTEKTTPDHRDYQKLLREMADKEVEYVVMEVSSHALDQCRLADTHFVVGAFTNLTQDHLDYHGTMEEYFLAKKKLFSMCDKGVICVDDAYGKRMFEEIDCDKASFTTIDKNANFYARNIKMSVEGVEYTLKSRGVDKKIKFCTPGLFSIQNSMAAAISCMSVGLSVNTVSNAIEKCEPVKGRSELVPTGRDFSVICDYAHSPGGLKNILDSVNSFKKARVITLVGCGGDRDKIKRPIMGEVAAKNSDFLVVTSDNPRTEDPDAIIDEIIPGVERTDTPYVRITDRRSAIEYALKNAKKDDIILLTGKGHEDYQVLGTKKVHFDEREEVKKAIEKIFKD